MSDECDECPVCGTPILAVEIRGPTEAERYASPCGHRLPPDFDVENQSVGDRERNSDGADEELPPDEWAVRLAEQAGDGGGCLETALAAADQRAATEQPESRRGVVKGLSAMLAAFGLGGAATGAAAANPHAPGTPTVAETYVCTGKIDIECVAAAAGGGGGCYPCAWKPSHLTCVPCAAALVGAGIMSRHECCVGGEWISTHETQ
jgi:hypothetical protein